MRTLAPMHRAPLGEHAMPPQPARRQWITLAAAAACIPRWARAESWPTRPVRLVCPTPPGGPTDRLARLLAVELTASLGQPVVVDNRPGAGNAVGTAAVAAAPADGYTLLLTGIFNAVNASLYSKLPYHYLNEFVQVAMLSFGPNVLVARPEFPVDTLDQLVLRAKARPGSIDFASGGNATSGHLTMALFQHAAGIELTRVPYKGAAQALQDVLGGVVSLFAVNQDTALPHVRAGKLKALAVTSPQRNPAYPGVPTFVESGFDQVVVTAWAGVAAPRGTPASIVERLRAAVVAAAQQPGLRRPLEADGWVIASLPPAEFEGFVRAETERWARIVRTARIQVE